MGRRISRTLTPMPRSSGKISTLPSTAPLEIRRVEALPLALPLAKPMQMAGERLTHGETLVVRIEAASGITGWGEAASAKQMTGDTLDGMADAVERTLAPLLVAQDATTRAALVARCRNALTQNRSAVAAIDMALLDLLGRHHGIPVSALLGGAQRPELQALWLLGNKTCDADVAEAVAKQHEGFAFFKLKVGAKPVAEDIRTALEVRRALGPGAKLCADANMGLTFDQAREFVTGARAADLLFLEQPFGKRELAQSAELARLSPCAIGADEAIGSLQDIVENHRAGAASGVSLKTIKLGGVAVTVRAGAVCEALGMAVNLAAKVAESSIGAAALLHIGSVLADTAWGVSPSNHFLAADIVKSRIVPRRGSYRPPQGPGLGVEVDIAELKRYRV